MKEVGHEQRYARYREEGWWTGERLQDRYARIVAQQPDGLAVIDDRGRRFGHAELWRHAGALAKEFEARGLGAADILLVLMPNWAECQVAVLATLRLGAVPANLPIRTSAENLAHALELSGARAVLTCELHGSNHCGELARDAGAACGHALQVLAIDDDGSRSWTSHGGDERAAIDAVPGLDHLMFTSSTTGPPKGVMHTSDSLAALNIAFTQRFELGPDRPIFMPSPLGHSVGVVHGTRLSLYNGAPLVLQDRWDPQRALELVAAHRCWFTAAATPFLKDLVDADWQAEDAKLESMRYFLCGGAQVPPSLMEQAHTAFPETFVTVLWGMTEGVGTTCVPDSPPEKQLETAGIGLPAVEFCVLDEAGNKQPTGAEGELAMRGPGIFFGYFAQTDLYESLMTEDGYFRTGDLSRIDAHGYVRITGRLKDLIIRGGVNISPVPIENALAAHPGVKGVAVIGYPDDRMGERLCAVIVPRGEIRPELQALTAFVLERGLPKYLCPEIVRFVEAFPTTAAGKIRKQQLRDAIVAADGKCDQEPSTG